jgi:hypothetical protein
MRTLLAAALVLAAAAPVAADEPSNHHHVHIDFWRATYGIEVTRPRVAIALYQCNVGASKALAERKDLSLGRSVASDAERALAACSVLEAALAATVDAGEVAAIRGAIHRANVTTIQEARNPRDVACASQIHSSMCWLPRRR